MESVWSLPLFSKWFICNYLLSRSCLDGMCEIPVVSHLVEFTSPPLLNSIIILWPCLSRYAIFVHLINFHTIIFYLLASCIMLVPTVFIDFLPIFRLASCFIIPYDNTCVQYFPGWRNEITLGVIILYDTWSILIVKWISWGAGTLTWTVANSIFTLTPLQRYGCVQTTIAYRLGDSNMSIFHV